MWNWYNICSIPLLSCTDVLGTASFSQWVMIETLSDDVLLDIFRHCLFASLTVWPTLTHICRRWRQIVLRLPLGLHLQLYCMYGTPVSKNLYCWSPFPLILTYGGFPMLDPPAPEDKENIVAALTQSHCISSISLTVTNPPREFFLII